MSGRRLALALLTLVALGPSSASADTPLVAFGSMRAGMSSSPTLNTRIQKFTNTVGFLTA
jgi:hypothetical protein